MRTNSRTVTAANQNKTAKVTTKELAAQGAHPSTVDNPVKFVKAFLARRKKIDRKKALAMLVANGVNFHTASTQYQAFMKARGA